LDPAIPGRIGDQQHSYTIYGLRGSIQTEPVREVFTAELLYRAPIPKQVRSDKQYIKTIPDKENLGDVLSKLLPMSLVNR